MKCQSRVARIDLGFGNGRGSYERTAVDIIVRHRVQVLKETSFVPDAPPFSFASSLNDLRGSLRLCGITYRAFLSLGSRAPTGSIPRAACTLRVTQNARPRRLFVLRRSAKGGGTPNSHGRRTRYWMTTPLMLPDAFASRDGRIKCMLDLTEWGDDRPDDL